MGATPGRTRTEPRAKDRRGGGISGQTAFITNAGDALRQVGASNRNAASERGKWGAGLAAFQQAAKGSTSRAAQGEDDELAGALAAAADAVQLEAGMERAGLVADYQARARYARRHLPRAQQASALRAIKDAKAAALALLSRRTALRLKTRLQALRQERARRRPDGSPPA